MNWGWKITLLYTGFVVMILTFVIASTMQDFSLVRTDYYEEEVRYQAQIDRIQRTRALKSPLEIVHQMDDGTVLIQYPTEHTTPAGTITLYRPSSASQDQLIPISPNADHRQSIETEKLLPGLWKVQVSWQSEGLEYFKEQAIVI